MIPGLGTKYDIQIETISKPNAEYLTDDYFELDLPVIAKKGIVGRLFK